MKKRTKSTKDRDVKAFTGSGIDLEDNSAFLKCLSETDQEFSIVFPVTLVRRLISLGLALSGALEAYNEAEAFALTLRSFRFERRAEGGVLLRLVLDGGLPLSFLLCDDDLISLQNMLKDQLATPTSSSSSTLQ